MPTTGRRATADGGIGAHARPSPRPDGISMAHRTGLLVDELPESSQIALEVPRQPPEHGRMTISRARGSIMYPDRVMLLGAMNPCPGGYYGDGPPAFTALRGLTARVYHLVLN